MEAAGTCPYGACLWFSQSCAIGCPKCLGVSSTTGKCDNPTTNATIPLYARTYDLDKECGTNPWCAPGSSPIMNPCGIAAGDNQQGRPGNGGDAPPGFTYGDAGTSMPETLPQLKRTWKVGATVDVAWAIVANHGGGYQYRLCKKGDAQTEECFQRTPLQFVGNHHALQYTEAGDFPPLAPTLPANATPASFPPNKAFPVPVDKSKRVVIPAIDVTTGTIPAGSTWRRNPIPGCNALAGGAFNFKCGKTEGRSASDFQFPPAGPDLAKNASAILLGGFGAGSCGGCNQPNNNNPSFCLGVGKHPGTCTAQQSADQVFAFSIVDQVKVPQVPPGEYTVSFRWDCEQTAQIWAQCSDITITA